MPILNFLYGLGIQIIKQKFLEIEFHLLEVFFITQFVH